ncbi:DP-fucose transporter with 9 transmembrane domains [Cryptosporidium sp. chipmunk genotype I]|uniref:DP-fucose transporter with 9 transmembrane domains n=1 Tax=Cryptosporidium sp. chipmunk genotype I TaxID=1280935 RepID=UPI00351A0851|nr:DP-fucose transporter with 9 transmembrane domains [Cryptosporidium sp. chipmunk genotype I]
MIELSLEKSIPKKEGDIYLINFQKYCESETDLVVKSCYEINNTENYDISNKKFNIGEILIFEDENVNNGREFTTESAIEVSELMNSKSNTNQLSDSFQTTAAEESISSILLSIAIYMIVSISIVFLNYKIFSGIIEFPIFVSWFQQLVGLAIFQILKIYKNQLSIGLSEFSHFDHLEWQTGKSMIPLVLSFIGMVSLSNICLKNVLVSTYQVARSTTIIFNLTLSYIILKQKSSIMTVISCIIVMTGFMIGAFDSNTLNLNGVIYGVFSSILQSFYSVLVKKQLNSVNNNQIQLLYYQLFLSSIMFVPILIITGEIRYFYMLFDIGQGIVKICLVLNCLTASGFLSVLINFSTFQLIKKTNSVTFNIIALLKSCIQSIGGILLFNEIVTFQSTFGTLLTLFGTFMYSFNSNPRNTIKIGEYEDLENRA